MLYSNVVIADDRGASETYKYVQATNYGSNSDVIFVRFPYPYIMDAIA